MTPKKVDGFPKSPNRPNMLLHGSPAEGHRGCLGVQNRGEDLAEVIYKLLVFVSLASTPFTCSQTGCLGKPVGVTSPCDFVSYAGGTALARELRKPGSPKQASSVSAVVPVETSMRSGDPGSGVQQRHHGAYCTVSRNHQKTSRRQIHCVDLYL